MRPVRDPAIRVILMPRDTNERGTIFGGVILSQIDLAGAVEVRKISSKRFVTVAMKEVVFKEPVRVGDIVSFYTRTERIGTTSITVHVDVEAQRREDPDHVVKVTEATVVYVAVDDAGRPVPVADPAHTLRKKRK
jgi:acyl-CoA thioesterase YciA